MKRKVVKSEYTRPGITKRSVIGYSAFNQFPKVIKNHGNFRGFYRRSSVEVSKYDRRLVYRLGDRFKPRNKTWSSVEVMNSNTFNGARLFSVYSEMAKPMLAYIMIKRRSYKKKKKIFRIRYAIKVASRKNKISKLYHQTKVIYFSKFKQKKTNNDATNFKKFYTSEVLELGNSYICKYKDNLYMTRGDDALQSILMTQKVA